MYEGYMYGGYECDFGIFRQCGVAYQIKGFILVSLTLTTITPNRRDIKHPGPKLNKGTPTLISVNRI